MTPPDRPASVLKAVARASVGGVRTCVELVLAPTDDGAVAGLVSVACCPGVVLATLLLRGDDLEVWDAPCRKLDRRLERVFRMPAADVRDQLCDLAERMVGDIVTGANPASATVH